MSIWLDIGLDVVTVVGCGMVFCGVLVVGVGGVAVLGLGNVLGFGVGFGVVFGGVVGVSFLVISSVISMFFMGMVLFVL